MKILRNLLPRDTRCVEIASAFGLIFSSLFFAYGNGGDYLLQVHPTAFWFVFSGLLGVLQFFSILFYPKLELLRVLAAFTSGTCWLYWGFAAPTIDQDEALMFTVGFGNLYGFIINLNLLLEFRAREVTRGVS
jgi:hypothetical protein